jgi:hypothetical protein
MSNVGTHELKKTKKCVMGQMYVSPKNVFLWEEKLAVPLIATLNVDKCNRS